MCIWHAKSLQQSECSPRENYFESDGQNVRLAFNALPDISIPCRTFFLVDEWKICPTFFVSLANISVYWTLPDKMSGNVVALCRTSAKVCWTCPACPAYFARTVNVHRDTCNWITHIGPAGIYALFPLSHPTFKKGAAQKKLDKNFILIKIFSKIKKKFPPVLPIKKFSIRKRKHGV